MEFPVRATSDDFIRTLGVVLTKIVSDVIPEYGSITCFNSINAPPISDYLVRIAKYVNCSNECFVLALVYIDRIMKLHKFSVSVLNIHRLLITSVMLAAKFSDDVYYSNSFYAQVGGIKVAEINLLEAQFLVLIKYQLFVNANDYENCRKGVESSSTKIYSLPQATDPNSRMNIMPCRAPQVNRPGSNSYHNTNYINANYLNGYKNNNPNVDAYLNTRPYTNLVSCNDHTTVNTQKVTTANNPNFAHTFKRDVDLSSINGNYLLTKEKLKNTNYLMYQYGGAEYPFARTDSSLTISTSASDSFDHVINPQTKGNMKSKFDECEAFVNALENRYKDTLKRKCSNVVGVEQFGLVNLKNDW